jgi:pyruvate dehydrogenase (quinone)
MARNVADLLWEMLDQAGVKRCYGIVGDALNPVIDALRRNGKIEFIHVRHEEYGVFAAVADSYLTENPVAVCGTAGPGTAHLLNGLMDALKERAPVIAIAGDVETRIMDTSALEELNPYRLAEAMGAKGIRLEEPGDVKDTLAEALAYKDGPVVVDAVVDPLALSLPSHIPFHAAKGYTLSLAKQVLNGRLDAVIKTIEHNVHLV